MTLEMEYPEVVLIKEERVSDYSDNDEDLMEMHINVDVKIENNELCIENWHMQNPLLPEVDKQREGSVIQCHFCNRTFSNRYYFICFYRSHIS